jgi:hypothetical protein
VRARNGVEPICRILGVSASAYYQRATGERSARSVEDERLTERIGKVHGENYECYRYRRVHGELVRQGETAGRDQIARLMRAAGIKGASGAGSCGGRRSAIRQLRSVRISCSGTSARRRRTACGSAT